MHILEISISSLNHAIVRPTKTKDLSIALLGPIERSLTKTPKLADKKCAQFYHLTGRPGARNL
jgi:hypothetical protein